MKSFAGTFYKYQATGNDFVMIDDRKAKFPVSDRRGIQQICDRRFGIGADGLILIQKDTSSDFRMLYFNADGAEGSLCGNGGRCAVAFAKKLGMLRGTTCTFRAVDALHQARIDQGLIHLQMAEVSTFRETDKYTYLDTGSPHHVQEVGGLEAFDVYTEGRRLRYSLYGEPGCNINFVSVLAGDRVRVRTYERGVENETFSCGTGVTAVALALHRRDRLSESTIAVETRGGELRVQFRKDEQGGYRDIWLTGPAECVFEGRLS